MQANIILRITFMIDGLMALTMSAGTLCVGLAVHIAIDISGIFNRSRRMKLETHLTGSWDVLPFG